MTAEAKLLSEEQLSEVETKCSPGNLWTSDQMARVIATYKSNIAALTAQRDKATAERDEYQRAVRDELSEHNELRKAIKKAGLIPQRIDRELVILNPLAEDVAQLQAQLDAARQEAERAKGELAEVIESKPSELSGESLGRIAYYGYHDSGRDTPWHELPLHEKSEWQAVAGSVVAALSSPADLETIAAEAYKEIWPDAHWRAASDTIKAKWIAAAGRISAHYRGESKAPGEAGVEELAKAYWAVVSNGVLEPWEKAGEHLKSLVKQGIQAVAARVRAASAAEIAERDARIAELSREKERVTNLLDKADTAANELAKVLGERTDVMYGEWVADLGELVKKVADLRAKLEGVERERTFSDRYERIISKLSGQLTMLCELKGEPLNFWESSEDAPWALVLWAASEITQLRDELAGVRQRAEGAEKELRDKKNEVSSLRQSVNDAKPLRARLRECEAVRNVQYKGLIGAETFIEVMHTELFMVEMDSDDKARLQDKLKDAAREISSTMGKPTRQILIKQEYEIADLEKKLAAAKEQLAESRRNVESLNAVLREQGHGQGEIDSWADSAEENERLRAALADLADRAERARRIVNHSRGNNPNSFAMLDTTNARAALQPAHLPSPAPAAFVCPMCGGGMRLKEHLSARDGELERLRRACEPFIDWFTCASAPEKTHWPDSFPVFPGVGKKKQHVTLGHLRAFVAAISPPDPATQPDSPPAFRCPRCGFREHGSDGYQIYCLNMRCNWSGTWSEVEAAQAGARGEGE